MQNQYIVRTDDNVIISFLYTPNTGISMKTFLKGKWHKSKVIIRDVRELYTVNLCENGDIYLFCQSINGDIIFCRNSKNEDFWHQKVILENNAKSVQNIIFNSIVTKSGINLIYNIPAESKNTYYLMSQKLNSDAKWSNAVKIDKIVGFYDGIFQLQMRNDRHGIIFYKKFDSKNCIGYREVNSECIGEFNLIYSSNFLFGDCTFLTAEKTIHFLYTVKNVFSSKVIYKKKDSTGVKEAVVIGEGQQINNCLLMIVKNRLFAFWCNSDKLFYCFSDDDGNSFSQPSKYRRKFCLNPKKAAYLSYANMKESRFFLRNAFVDSTNPKDIQIVSDLYEEFYFDAQNNINDKTNSSVNVIRNTSGRTAENLSRDGYDYEQSGGLSNMQSLSAYNPFSETIKNKSASAASLPNELNGFEAQVKVLKNKIETNKKNLDAKDSQIGRLMASLQKKNKELIDIEKDWQQKYRTVSAENEELKKKILELQNMVNLKEKSDNSYSDNTEEDCFDEET